MNEIDFEKIGKFIVELRQKKGVTQLDLADALSVSRKTISKIETGRMGISIDLLKGIADYFGITLEELINGEPEKKSIMENGTLPPNKLTHIFISSVILVVLFFLFIYWATTFNKIHIYTFYSTTNATSVTGNFIKTNNRRIFNIHEVKLNDKNYYNEKYYAAEYSVIMNEDDVIQHVGDISNFDANNKTELHSLKEYIENIRVYIIDELPNFEKPTLNDYTIKVRYINENAEEETYEIHFEMNTFFSNNKIFYEKNDI